MRAEPQRIDDGSKDIAVVGIAGATACKAQFDQMVVALGKNLSAQDRQTLRNKLSDMQAGFSTAVAAVALSARAESLAFQLRHRSTRSVTGFSNSRPSARARRYSFLWR